MKWNKRKLYVLPIAALAVGGYFGFGALNKTKAPEAQNIRETIIKNSGAPTDTAIFAGGCFWHMEEAFQELDGVTEVYTGYTGGQTANPTYNEVGSGKTGHVESVEVHYDPNYISYDDLLQAFWRNVDPTDADGQFGDRGSPYRSAIFYANDEQKQAAEQSEQQLTDSKRFDKPIVTTIAAASTFYKAEKEHQDYYKKSGFSYKLSEFMSDRESFVKKAWGKELEVTFSAPQGYAAHFDKEAELKTLTKLQYNVTQNGSDEQPYHNEYWDNEEEGIYVDVVSGEPLFSSKDKYDAGTGWPSFTKPLEPNNIVLKEGGGIFPVVHVNSKLADSFIGDVFQDGPKPAGLRFCMNSAAMEFVPKAELEQRGYGAYVSQFN